MSERIFLTLLQSACRAHGVDMSVDSDGWLVQLKKQTLHRQIAGMNFDLNTQAAAAIARDKVATGSRLRSMDIAHVPHSLHRVGENKWDSPMIASLIARGDIVIKPLEGGDGKHVYRIHDTTELARLSNTGVTSWAISPWEDIVKEVRVVVVEGACWLAYEKSEPVTIDDLKFFNLSLGAVARHVDVPALPDAIRQLAVDATEAIGLTIAAVDIVVTASDEMKVLEINSAFSLTRYAKTNAAAYGEVAAFYDRLIASMFST